MAKGFSTRSAAHVLWVAVAMLLLTAGIALAASSGKIGGGQGSGKHGRVSDARALVGSNRCVQRTAAKRAKLPRVRRRCARKPAAAVNPQPLYWGATIGSHLTGDQAPWDMNAVASFEQGAGKSASMVQFFQPFAECGGSGCSFDSFPTQPMDDIRGHGSIPVLSWSSQAIPSTLDQPDFQLSDVISGRYDEFIAEFAAEARDWGHPFFLRFNWEMNGNWFPWAEGVNGNGTGEYVAAWRHVHDIFAAVGATNVSWVWCPFVDPGGSLTSLASLYPGDAYVDWTGLDGYNWGTNPASPRGWRTFDQLFRRSYDEIQAIAPSKAMMLAEVGSSEYGGSKAEWIRDALARVPTEYPQIRALLWFDKFDDDMDWPIESSAPATAAFAEGVQQPVYVGAGYGGLAGGAIAPPS
ncbi:MAG TPA: glycosyl hydrolase [Solirubrobacterales bacterium]|nr:glycosyl hydrolase [Solirubrobacterales bacterium]